MATSIASVTPEMFMGELVALIEAQIAVLES